VADSAAAALCAPLALSIAEKLQVDYKPFVVVIMISASASFLTPIGYQVCTVAKDE
jgi:di/tricarboxylate transporter